MFNAPRYFRVVLLAACSALGVACGGGPPTLPHPITSMSVTHDAGSGETALKVDKDELVNCLKASKAIAIDELYKCVLTDGDYRVDLNDGQTVIEIHNATQYVENDLRYFSNQCLYPLLAKAAQGKAPSPGGC